MSVSDPGSKLCSVCKNYSNPQYLEICPGCKREDVCDRCFLKSKNGLEKRCLECVIPYCGEPDCGWEGSSSKELKRHRLQPEDIEFNLCPVCRSPVIFALVPESEERIVPETDFTACSICDSEVYPYNLLKQCKCGTRNVGFCCSLVVDKSGGLARRCFDCAVPVCEECGWEGIGVMGQGTQYVTEKKINDIVVFMCPRCGSHSILAHPEKFHSYGESKSGNQQDPTNVPSPKPEKDIPRVFKNLINELDSIDDLGNK